MTEHKRGHCPTCKDNNDHINFDACLRAKDAQIKALKEENIELLTAYDEVDSQRDRYREALEKIASDKWAYREMPIIAQEALEG